MLASAVVLGVAAGRAFGGHLARLGDLRLRWWPLLAVAVALRAAAPALGEPLAAWVVAFGLIVAVALANRRLPGMWPIGVGALLNVIVVLANGAMPVDPAAAVSAGAEIRADGLHRAMRDGDALTALADLIPAPVIANVYSAGDVLLALGGFWVPFSWMRRR